MNTRRREIAARYDRALASTGATLPAAPAGSHHVYGCYTLLVEDRDRVRTGLADAGIATATYYRVPLHRQPHFSRSCRFGAMPVAERAARHCLSLPMFPQLTDEEVEYVATTAARALS
jgi:dTDP-4-amino-4,6-dideoxygalactose transaminase